MILLTPSGCGREPAFHRCVLWKRSRSEFLKWFAESAQSFRNGLPNPQRVSEMVCRIPPILNAENAGGAAQSSTLLPDTVRAADVVWYPLPLQTAGFEETRRAARARSTRNQTDGRPPRSAIGPARTAARILSTQSCNIGSPRRCPALSCGPMIHVRCYLH